MRLEQYLAAQTWSVSRSWWHLKTAVQKIDNWLKLHIWLLAVDVHFQTFDKTVQKLNEGFNLHKTRFKHPSKHGHWKILFDYFTKGICEGAKYRVQIIAKMECSARTKRAAMDPSLHMEWMIKLVMKLQPIKKNYQVQNFNHLNLNMFPQVVLNILTVM